MKTSPKLFGFVLMPFDQSFNDVYKLGIKAACESVGIYCERVDEQIFQETILERVYNQISKADIVIADMSGRNPNVFYEVGYAHAIGKTTILLTNKAEDIPFDLKHFQHIVYDGSISRLKEELSKRLLWIIEHPNPKELPQKIYFNIFLGQYNLLQHNVIYECPENEVPYPKFTIHNPTPYTFEPGKFRIGILSPERYAYTRTQGIETVKLPDKKHMFMLPYLENLFPDAYGSFELMFNEKPEMGQTEKFIIRIFSEIGTFDYPFFITSGSTTGDAVIKTA